MSTQTPQNDQSSGFTIRSQYIKDLSFENPNSPQSLFLSGGQPDIKVGVDIKAQKIQEDLYETVLHINVRAKMEGATMFLADLAYGGLFQVANTPAEAIEPMVMVDFPFVLFPFARRVISDVVRDGGFPPLMLEPINFHSLYLQNKAQL